MQNLLAKHGSRIVADGNLKGTPFRDIPEQRLLRVAKRYTGDDELRKFAKAYVTLLELEQLPEPQACEPLRAAPAQQLLPVGVDVPTRPALVKVSHVCRWIWKAKLIRYALLVLAVSFIVRPSVSKVVTRFAVATARLMMRRFLDFVGSLVFGLVEEILLQLEFVAKQALPTPANLTVVAQETFNLVSHAMSGLVGALLASLAHMRRQPVVAA
eukprot:s919_g16.t1